MHPGTRAPGAEAPLARASADTGAALSPTRRHSDLNLDRSYGAHRRSASRSSPSGSSPASPLDSTSLDNVVAPASHCPPDRRHETHRAVPVVRHRPSWPSSRQDGQLDGSATATRTCHGGEPAVPAFADKIDRPSIDSLGKVADEGDAIGRRLSTDLPPTSQRGEEDLADHAHFGRLRIGRLSIGVTSPRPTYRVSAGSGGCAFSARWRVKPPVKLSVTIAKSPLGSSR